MRISRFAYALCSLMLAVPIIVISAVDRAASWLFSFLPVFASEPRLATDGPALAFETFGSAGDPALLNSLRHEAGMRRLT